MGKRPELMPFALGNLGNVNPTLFIGISAALITYSLPHLRKLLG
ncbi:hypothetical protein [Thermococcus zilligii]|nr:hypothetical protein [Thermococcus zilligii]